MPETPKYQLNRAAYNRPAPGSPLRVMNAGDFIETDDVPGHHMEPVNDAAKAIVKKLGERSMEDPERRAIRELATAKFDPNAMSGVHPGPQAGK